MLNSAPTLELTSYTTPSVAWSQDGDCDLGAKYAQVVMALERTPARLQTFQK